MIEKVTQSRKLNKIEDLGLTFNILIIRTLIKMAVTKFQKRNIWTRKMVAHNQFLARMQVSLHTQLAANIIHLLWMNIWTWNFSKNAFLGVNYTIRTS